MSASAMGSPAPVSAADGSRRASPIDLSPQRKTASVAIEYAYMLICANVPPAKTARTPYTPAILLRTANSVITEAPGGRQRRCERARTHRA